MPRITVAGGPSNPAAQPGEVGPELAGLPDGTAVVPAADYASMSQAVLRGEAKTRGLPVGGSKADLAARLNEHDQQAATAADDSAAQAAEPSGATA